MRILFVLLCMIAGLSAAGFAQTPATAVDLFSFAAGVVPLEVRGAATKTARVDMEKAVAVIDGNRGGFVLNRKPFAADDWVEFVYRLPAETTFTRWAVPDIFETPSPAQTFAQHVTVHGGATTDGPMTLLAEGALATHPMKGKETALTLKSQAPVRVVVVRLAGGVQPGATYFEFSELIGQGNQQPVPMATHFTGVWTPRLGLAGLTQTGSQVVGCLDKGRKTLTGSVQGNLLRATFKDTTSGVGGALILALRGGDFWGLRSDNGAPFRLYAGPAKAGTPSPCPRTTPPKLGCGSIVHGIQFGFDSATIQPGAEDILERLATGLKAETAAKVLIEGHTSSEGSAAYNLDLSERRAASVVKALIERGVVASKLAGAGIGEARPIARETTEAGRSLNRRVEVQCRP